MKTWLKPNQVVANRVHNNSNVWVKRVPLFTCREEGNSFFIVSIVECVGKPQFVCLIGGRFLTWGRRVPASALPTWGSMPQAGNTWISDIHVFVSQGIEPWLTNADAGTRRPQVRTRLPQLGRQIAVYQIQLRFRNAHISLHIFYLSNFYISCFIFTL